MSPSEVLSNLANFWGQFYHQTNSIANCTHIHTDQTPKTTADSAPTKQITVNQVNKLSTK